MRTDAQAIWRAGVSAVDPEAAVHRRCRRDGDELVIGDARFDLNAYRRVLVVGAGKASAAMARALETLVGDRIDGGIVSVKYGHGTTLTGVDVVEAGHPVPDAGGEQGARRILDLVSSADEDDLVLCLISGGASALLPLAADGLGLEDKQATIETLLTCGANIHEINTIRKHISRIKGGKLAVAAAPAAVVSLILSDVVGDDLDVIGSGPTVPDTTTAEHGMAILERYRITAKVPPSVVTHLQRRRDAAPIPPHPWNPVHNVIVGRNMDALLAAEKAARENGYHPLILGSMIDGDTNEAAGFHAALAKEVIQSGHPAPTPACLISGGETTVVVEGDGKGGRNQQFALAAALSVRGWRHVVVLSAGTDGTDGPTDAAGAIADDRTVSRASAAGIRPVDCLAANDAYHFFQRLDDLVVTGPTRTNVMDLRIMIVCRPEPSPGA